MPFIGQLCLTDLGGFELTDFVDIYSNVDDFTTPFVTNVLVESLSSDEGNCPYLLFNVPDGTTEVYILNSDDDVCLFLPIQSSDLCETCDFGFSQYSATSIGRLYVGVLTASCQSTLTDYAIDWYNEDNEIEFSSGIGNLFDYGYQQPALGNGGVFVPPGTYYPVIREVLINGIVFTSQGFSIGNIFASLDCLPNVTVVVQAYNCDNGTATGPYSHSLTFIGTSSNSQSIPEVMPVYLEIDSTITHIAWSFRAVSVTDQIKVVYSGQNYDHPFILDWFDTGFNISVSDFTNPPPYEVDPSTPTDILKKVNCLTGFTITNGDYIIFEIIPNQTNLNTDWYLDFECLDSFNCESCILTGTTKINLLDGFQIGNSTSACGSGKNFTLKYSADCSNFNDDLNNYFQTDLFRFELNPPPPLWTNLGSLNWYRSFNSNDINDLSISNNLQVTTGFLSWSNTSCGSGSLTAGGFSEQCISPNTNLISFSKSYNSGNDQAIIYMTFSNQNDFLTHWNDYNTTFLLLSNSTDPTNYGYYDGFRFIVKRPPSPTTPCGDSGTITYTYTIPKTATFSSGFTNNEYSLQITWGSITNGLSSSDCCFNLTNSFITTYNNSRTQQNISFTTNTGSRSINPIGFIKLPNNTNITTASTIPLLYWVIRKNQIETLPRNYNNINEFFPQYSSVTCPNLYNLQVSSNNPNYYVKNWSMWLLSLINPSNTEEFKVERRLTTGNELAFVYSGGTINNVNTDYVIQ
jgi:hypothetical protein